MQNDLAQKWQKPFLKAYTYLESAKIPVSKWSFGGGTALMHYYHHRYSKDIDIFLTDVQYLPRLSPRLNDYIESDHDYGGAEEQSNFIKIKLKGDIYIDFIAAPYLTKNPTQKLPVHGRKINVETPQEIVVKKMFYRADQFKSRDIFDLAVIVEFDQNKLLENIEVFQPKVAVLIERCRLLRKLYPEELSQLIIYRDKKFVVQSYAKALDFLGLCLEK